MFETTNQSWSNYLTDCSFAIAHDVLSVERWNIHPRLVVRGNICQFWSHLTKQYI